MYTWNSIVSNKEMQFQITLIWSNSSLVDFFKSSNSAPKEATVYKRGNESININVSHNNFRPSND